MRRLGGSAVALVVAGACSESPATSVPVPTAAPAPTTAAPAELPCPHPYLPFSEGASWTWSQGAGRAKRRVTAKVGRIEKSADKWRAPVEIRSGDRVARGTAECGHDGAYIETSAFHVFGDAGGLRGAYDLRAVGHEGVLVPPAGGLAVGAEWTLGSAMLVSVGDSMMKRSTVRLQAQLRRLADESVETPAGTFQAARIEAKGTATEEAILMGRSAPARTLPAFEAVLWVAPGVGIVKSSVAHGDMEREWSLVAHELP